MIPCRVSCPHFCEGCHKTCATCKRFQEQQVLVRRRKKAYLDYHKEVCNTIIRQCYRLQPYQIFR